MAVSKRFLALVCAVPLALAAALFLAPDEARAQQNVCGANSASDTDHTCDAAAYADGIWYDTQWDTPPHGDVTLRIPGASGTPLTIMTGPTTFTNTTRIDEAGVFMRVAGDVELVMGGATGGTAHAVQIAQRSGVTQSTPTPESGYGIYVLQPNHAQTGNTEAVRVTLNDGVAIGTSAAPMLHSGVRVHLVKGTGTAAHTVTSAARIHATIDGIYQSNSGLGANTLANTGDINAGRYGLFLNMVGAAAAGAASITNMGDIMVTGADANGIRLARTGTGDVTITNRGDITASGADSMGVFASTAFSTTTAGDMRFENSGAISSPGSGSTGVSLRHAGADATIVNSGAVTSGGHGIALVHTGTGASGAISVSNTARIAAGMTGTTLRHGISVSRAASSGTVSVTNSGDIAANGHGITVAAAGSGDVSVTNSGGIGTTSARVARGISALHTGTSGSLTVTNSGAIAGQADGIYASVAAGNSADLTVKATGGSVSADGIPGATAVGAVQGGTGSVTLEVSDGVTLTSKNGSGLWARIDHADNADGQIKITQGGTVSARTGVYAAVSRASASGETRAASAQPLIDVTWTGRFARGTGTAENDEDRLMPANVANAIRVVRELEIGAATHYGRAAGIEAHALSWRDAAEEVAKGDDPGPFPGRGGGDGAVRRRGQHGHEGAGGSDRGEVPGGAGQSRPRHDSGRGRHRRR